jgi:hypothetical protein
MTLPAEYMKVNSDGIGVTLMDARTEALQDAGMDPVSTGTS